MNNKNIISGTADQLRLEVEKSNGFATESQIQALAVARNKTLLERNAQLSNLIQSQQDAISTDTTLLASERQLASSETTNRMAILNYQKQNDQFMFNAVKDTYKTLMENDPSGLYNSLLTDPSQAQRFSAITGLDVSALQGMASNKNNTSDINNYNFAKSQGYKGTFVQWQQDEANRKAKATGETAAEKKSLSEYLGSVVGYGDRKDALSELESYKTKILNDVGQAGFDKLKAEIDRLYPESTTTKKRTWNPLTWF